MSARVPYLAGLFADSPAHAAPLRPVRRLFHPDLPVTTDVPSDMAPGAFGEEPAANDSRVRPAAPSSALARESFAPSADANAPNAPIARHHHAPLAESGGSPLTAGGRAREASRMPGAPPGMDLLPAPADSMAASTAANDPGGRTAEAPLAGERRSEPLARPAWADAPLTRPATADTPLARAPAMAPPATRHPVTMPPATASTQELAPRAATDDHRPQPTARPAAPSQRRGPAPGDASPNVDAARSAHADPRPPAPPATFGRDPGPASEPDPYTGLLSPAPGAGRVASAAAFASELPSGHGSTPRGTPTRVSIGTIEVTVVPASPAPVVAASTPQPAAGPPAASSRPVADRLRLGARRWYGMAQA